MSKLPELPYTYNWRTVNNKVAHIFRGERELSVCGKVDGWPLFSDEVKDGSEMRACKSCWRLYEKGLGWS